MAKIGFQQGRCKVKSDLVNMTFEIELQPGEKLSLPESLANSIGPGRWLITVQPLDTPDAFASIRDHSAFLNSYAPEDEGLYDDYPPR